MGARPLTLVGVLCILLVLAAVGVGFVRLRDQQRQTAQQLANTESLLAARQETLTLLESEREKLSQSYETLKERWTKSDAEVTRLSEEAAHAKTDLQTASAQHTQLQRQLDEAAQQRAKWESERERLERQLAARDADHEALEQQLNALSTRTLTPTELEQVEQALAQRDAEVTQLRQRADELASASEQASAAQPVAPTTPDDAARARASYRQPHTPAARGTPFALYEASTPTLGESAKAHGLPRNHWRLVWDWLTN